VNRAKAENRPVVAVGTTTARALEWAFETGLLTPREGLCSLFIRPGYTFRAVDFLITNFHLPKSSLMLLVGAMMDHSTLMRAYRLAVTERFNFFSYGDAMLIV
jgi:S-adenosylmethionine:tRNA ribosyltransferase-isomerase